MTKARDLANIISGGFTADDIPALPATKITSGIFPALDGSNLTGVLNSIAPTRHSIRPSLNLDFANSKVLDPRITFTRGSNATYYDGYTSVKAEENLFTYSQEFDNADWGKVRSTITANDTTAPDGTTTAERLAQETGQSVTPIVRQYQSVVSGNDYTISCYGKAGNRNFLVLREYIADGTVNNTFFNLSTGTVGTSDALHTATITDVGNSWYRCSITITAGSTNSSRELNIGNVTTDGTLTTTDDNGYIYIWGGQLEIRDSLTAYTPTTSSPITKYQPALQTAGNNVARFDHNPTTGESLGLLIEEQRTNLVNYSEGGNGVNGFSNGNGTFDLELENQSIAPDGTNTGLQLKWFKGTTSGDYAGVNLGAGTLSSAIRTFSFYGKSNTGSNQTMQFRTLGSIATSNITLTPEWQRFSITNPSATTTVSMQIWSPFSVSYTDNVDISIWGYQMEEGSFPTSYIKTTGSQVTRSVDSAEIDNVDTSEWFNIAKGTIYSEYNHFVPATVNAHSVFGFNLNGSSNNRMYYYGNKGQWIGSVDGTTTFSVATFPIPTLNTNHKVSVVYNIDDFQQTFDGASIGTDTSSNVPQVNGLGIGKVYQSSNYLNGYIKKLSYYPIRLTSNELIDLTEE